VTLRDFLTGAGAFSHVGGREFGTRQADEHSLPLATSVRVDRCGGRELRLGEHSSLDSSRGSGIDRHIDRVAFVHMCFASNRPWQPQSEAVVPSGDLGIVAMDRH
jgi:hypothetical protein